GDAVAVVGDAVGHEHGIENLGLLLGDGRIELEQAVDEDAPHGPSVFMVGNEAGPARDVWIALGHQLGLGAAAGVRAVARPEHVLGIGLVVHLLGAGAAG